MQTSLIHTHTASMVFMVVMRNFLYNIVEEKSEKYKETQRIMGVKDSAYQLSWISYLTLKSFIVTNFLIYIAFFLN